jgi:hypothetical protein
MNNNLKFSAKTTGLVILLCLSSFVVLGIQIAIFGENSSHVLMLDPIISGFLHAGFVHFSLNMILLFLALLSTINQTYNIVKIFWVTFFLSVLYLPVSILGITEPAIGISGTCYFLMSRYFFSWQKKPLVGKGIILFLALIELVNVGNTAEDKTAHVIHLLGVILGYLSLKTANLEKYLPKWISTRIAQ